MSPDDKAPAMVTEPVRPPLKAAAGELPALTDANAVFGIDDLEEEWVDVPEWNVRVRVLALTGEERDRWEDLRLVDKRNAKGKVTREVSLANFRASLVAMAVRHPEDATVRIFSDAQVARLGKKSAAALERVFDVARRLSRLSDEDIDELTDELKADPSGEPG